MDAQTLNAQPRSIVGRKVKSLRKEGTLPGNVFGNDVKSEAIQVSLKEFQKVYKEAGETGLIDLKIGDKSKPVLVSNLQLDPVTDTPLHVDFRQVDLKEKISAKVPVELTGEAPAEKSGVGTAVLYINEIEVEALPTDLPEKFVVDISALSEVDQSILAKDLSLDRTKVSLNIDTEAIIAKVEPPQKEEVVAPTPIEGEAPIEGDAAAGETEASNEGAQGGEEKPQEEKPKE